LKRIALVIIALISLNNYCLAATQFELKGDEHYGDISYHITQQENCGSVSECVNREEIVLKNCNKDLDIVFFGTQYKAQLQYRVAYPSQITKLPDSSRVITYSPRFFDVGTLIKNE